MRSDVVLVYPPMWCMHSVENLGLGYLAAELRQAGISTKIIDATLTDLNLRQTLDAIIEADPRIVGISTVQATARATIQLVKEIRANLPHTHINLGGQFASFCHDRLLRDIPAVDSILRGEGDQLFATFVQRILGGEDWASLPGVSSLQDGALVANPPAPAVTDLDSLPFPARDTAPMALAVEGNLGIITSRGCYGQCTYCSSIAFYGLQPGPKWRARSPENVLEEMSYLAGEYGCRDFVFHDDTFVAPHGRKRAHAFADEMLRRKLGFNFGFMCRANDVERDLFLHLKDAGLDKVRMGIESGCQSQLDRYKKGTKVEHATNAIAILRELDIPFDIYILMIDPDSTLTECAETTQFLATVQAQKQVVGSTTIAVPFEGTEMCDTLRQQGRLRGDYINGYSYTWKDPAMNLYMSIAKPLMKITSAIKGPRELRRLRTQRQQAIAKHQADQSKQPRHE